MQPIDYSGIVALIPPAAALAVLAYFTRLFGKVIADQAPFADDREWHRELNGIMFMAFLSTGVVGIAAALYLPHPFSYGWMHVVDLLLVVLAFLFITGANRPLSEKFFRINTAASSKLIEEHGSLLEWFNKIGKRFPLSFVLPIVLFYAGTVEYMSGSLIWMILIWPYILYVFILLAMNYSFRLMQERTPVAVNFTDSTRAPLTEVMVLKVNDDNIRVRDGDTILILNKDEVFSITMPVPENWRLKESDEK